MGRMQDALKKAAEERERKRIAEGHGVPPAPNPLDFEFQRTDPEPATTARALERHKEEAPASPALEAARRQTDERLVVFHSPHDERAEEFRKIRVNLLALDPRPRTVLVTSGAPNEGKSVTAANLALTFLEMGEPEVLLVDANLRHPELAGLLGARPSPGLANVIGGGALSPQEAIARTAIPNLYLLPAGTGSVAAARQLKPDVLRGVLDSLRGRFGFIVVDSPAASDYADAVLLSNDVDGVLVVVRVGSGRRAATRKTVDALDSSKARVLGTVVLAKS